MNSRMLGWANYYSYGTLSARVHEAWIALVHTGLRRLAPQAHVKVAVGERDGSRTRLLYEELGLVQPLAMVLATRRVEAGGESCPRAGCGKSARPVR